MNLWVGVNPLHSNHHTVIFASAGEWQVCLFFSSSHTYQIIKPTLTLCLIMNLDDQIMTIIGLRMRVLRLHSLTQGGAAAIKSANICELVPRGWKKKSKEGKKTPTFKVCPLNSGKAKTSKRSLRTTHYPKGYRLWVSKLHLSISFPLLY